MANYEPYSRNKNKLTLNSEDNIYLGQGGEYSLLNLVQLGSDYSSGFLGSLTLGVEAANTSSSTSTTSLTAQISTATSSSSTGTEGYFSTTIAASTLATASSGSVGRIERSDGVISVLVAGILGWLLM